MVLWRGINLGGSTSGESWNHSRNHIKSGTLITNNMKQEQEILELIKTNIDKFNTEDEHFDRMFNLGEITDNRGNRQRVWLTFTSTNMKLKNKEL